MGKRVLALVLGLLLVLWPVGSAGWAAPLLQPQSMITHPADGSRVGGQIEVRGVARHPNIDFYQLRYAPGAQPDAASQWADFAIVEGRQVDNDVLGVWDTTQLPDGQYTLALAVWGINDPNNPYLYFTTSLTVDNTELVLTPTPTPEPEPTEVVPTPTVGPTPTPMAVEQPPTVTPFPTATIAPDAAETPTVAPEEGPDLAVSIGPIRDGFCTGGLISFFLLTVWGLYVMLKIGIRWILRQRSAS